MIATIPPFNSKHPDLKDVESHEEAVLLADFLLGTLLMLARDFASNGDLNTAMLIANNSTAAYLDTSLIAPNSRTGDGREAMRLGLNYDEYDAMKVAGQN